MSEEIKQIMNKYDIHDVEKTFSQHIETILTTKHKFNKTNNVDYLSNVVRLFLSVVIPFSFFHKVPFPKDKSIILVCVILYYLLNGVLILLQKFFLKNYELTFTRYSPRNNKNLKIIVYDKLFYKAELNLFSSILEIYFKINNCPEIHFSQDYSEILSDNGYFEIDKIESIVSRAVDQLDKKLN